MIAAWNQQIPRIDPTAFVAPSAEIIGRVTVGPGSSIWYQAVLRGDLEAIVIGGGSNIQDHCTLHTSDGVSPCVVGDGVTVGHRAILHGCSIGDRALIGMGAVVMDRAVVEAECIVAAGALVTEGKRLKSGLLYAGVPARERRALTDAERAFLARSAEHYREMASLHRRTLRPIEP